MTFHAYGLVNLDNITIIQYICWQVMESEEFMELPVNQLMDIISSEELNVRSEEQVFSAVMAWVKYNVTERRPYLAQVSVHLVWLWGRGGI